MSWIDTALDVFDSPLTQQGLAIALGFVPPPFNLLVNAAVRGAPTAIRVIGQIQAGKDVTHEELAALWPAIQAEAKRVGAEWDASEAAKTEG